MKKDLSHLRDTLKPCPCCGSIGIIKGYFWGTYFVVSCIQCCLRLPGKTAEAAHADWNRRHEESYRIALIESLQATVESHNKTINLLYGIPFDRRSHDGLINHISILQRGNGWLEKLLCDRDELFRFVVFHTPYGHCGYDQLTAEQRELFDIIMDGLSPKDSAALEKKTEFSMVNTPKHMQPEIDNWMQVNKISDKRSILHGVFPLGFVSMLIDNFKELKKRLAADKAAKDATTCKAL